MQLKTLAVVALCHVFLALVFSTFIASALSSSGASVKLSGRELQRNSLELEQGQGQGQKLIHLWASPVHSRTRAKQPEPLKPPEVTSSVSPKAGTKVRNQTGTEIETKKVAMETVKRETVKKLTPIDATKSSKSDKSSKEHTKKVAQKSAKVPTHASTANAGAEFVLTESSTEVLAKVAVQTVQNSPEQPKVQELSAVPHTQEKAEVSEETSKMVVRETPKVEQQQAVKEVLAEALENEVFEEQESVPSSPSGPSSPSKFGETAALAASAASAALHALPQPASMFFFGSAAEATVDPIESEEAELSPMAPMESMDPMAPMESMDPMDSMASKDSKDPQQAQSLLASFAEGASAFVDSLESEPETQADWSIGWSNQERRLLSEPSFTFPHHLLEDMAEQSVEVVFQVDPSGRVISASFEGQDVLSYNWELGNKILNVVRRLLFTSVSPQVFSKSEVSADSPTASIKKVEAGKDWLSRGQVTLHFRRRAAQIQQQTQPQIQQNGDLPSSTELRQPPEQQDLHSNSHNVAAQAYEE